MGAKRPTGPPPLLYGPYLSPACKVGSRIEDVVRGPSVVGGFSDAPLPWPTHPNNSPLSRPASLVITAELERAIRAESSVALQYWLAVSGFTVTKMRRALGVGRTTPGTRHRHAEVAIPPDEQSTLRGAALAKTPDAMRRRDEAMKGKYGRPRSPATRAAIGAANKRAHTTKRNR